MATEALLPSRQAAEQIGLSEKTLVTWRCLGKGPRYVKMGGKVFYRPADLAAFVDEHIVDPRRVGV